MLQLAEQRPERNAGEAGEAFNFLVNFTREMIKLNPSGDVLQLAMMAAAKRSNLTKEQATKFIAWVLEQQSDSPWPKGFF